MKQLSYMLTIFFLITSCFLTADSAALYTDMSANILQYQKIVAENSENISREELFLIDHVKESIRKAELEEGNLSIEVLNIHGMSSPKNRYLLNALCQIPQTRYLEIGCWKGSTFISALFGNEGSVDTAIAIDNWTGFGGPLDEFQANCEYFINKVPYKIYSHNSFSVDPKTYITQPINIYFYDGGHSREQQADAFIYFNDVLDDVFIAIIDDWNWERVRQGTFDAFKQLGYEVLYEVSLPSTQNGNMEQWWNGLYVVVIRK